MTSKRELKLEIAELQGNIVNLKGELNKERAADRRMEMDMQDKIETIKEQAIQLYELKKGQTKQIGIMTVDVPLTTNVEKSDEILKLIQERMDMEMESLGVNMDLIIMPSIVKEIKTITVKVNRKEELNE